MGRMRGTGENGAALPDVSSETSFTDSRRHNCCFSISQEVSMGPEREGESGGGRWKGKEKQEESEERTGVRGPGSCFTVWFDHMINLDWKR